jgi:hypothetical protein
VAYSPTTAVLIRLRNFWQEYAPNSESRHRSEKSATAFLQPANIEKRLAIPRQLSTSPMRVLPIGIEHALCAMAHRLQHSDPLVRQWASIPIVERLITSWRGRVFRLRTLSGLTKRTQRLCGRGANSKCYTDGLNSGDMLGRKRFANRHHRQQSCLDSQNRFVPCRGSWLSARRREHVGALPGRGRL